MLVYLYSNIRFQVMVFEHTEDITFSRRFYLNQKLKLKKKSKLHERSVPSL